MKFRISLNLSKFFDDHRAKAMLLISKDMKLMRDVKKKIARLFRLEKFFLSCGDGKMYLALEESVEILEVNEELWVVPKLNSKNKEKIDRKKTEISVEPIEVEEEPLKKRKRKRESIKKAKSSKYDSNDDLKDSGVSSGRTSVSSPTNDNLKDSSPSKAGVSCSVNILPARGPKVKSLVENFEHPQNDFKEQLEHTLRKNIESKVNIVKSITIFNREKEKVDENIDAMSEQNLEEQSITSSEVKMTPKRRRVRKRKRAIPETPKFQLPSNIVPTPQQTPPPNRIHVRFDSPKKMAVDLAETEIGEIQDTQPKNEALTEELILKQPVAQNITPKINDFIAFKILRMSEHYTPEVSSYIVGKVLATTEPETEYVTFQIIYGHDQCLPPQGKFSLDDVAIDIEEVRVTYSYSVKDLIEVRPLFL